MKEDVAALVAAQPLPVPTLALNSLAGDTPPPSCSSSRSTRSRRPARRRRRIAADGHVRGIALFPRNAWGERAARGVHGRAAGGRRRAGGRSQFYDPAARDFSGPLRAALGRYGGAGDRTAKGAPVRRDAAAEARDGPQFAFIAAPRRRRRGRSARSCDSRWPTTLPVYATSDAWDPAARAVPDLDGLTFPEMPWILHAGLGAPELWEVLQATVRGRARPAAPLCVRLRCLPVCCAA